MNIAFNSDTRLSSIRTAYFASAEENVKRTVSTPNRDEVIISQEGRERLEVLADKVEVQLNSMTKEEFMGMVEQWQNENQEPLTVNWNAVVDPYGTFTSFAKAESRLRQLADTTASKKDEDMEKVAQEYAKSKIDILIEKKKALLDSGMAKSKSEEYAEYKTAYDAYHSENGGSLIAIMTGDTKKAYNIYKNIIDGTSISIEDEEFLMLHNRTMYVGAKGEYIRKTDELYNAMNGAPVK